MIRCLQTSPIALACQPFSYNFSRRTFLTSEFGAERMAVVGQKQNRNFSLRKVFMSSQKVFSSTSSEKVHTSLSGLLNPSTVLLHACCQAGRSFRYGKRWCKFPNHLKNSTDKNLVCLLKRHKFLSLTVRWNKFSRATIFPSPPMASRDHRWQFRTENAFLFFIIRIQFIFLRHRTDFCRAQRKNNFHIAIFLRLVSAQRWKNVFRIKFDFYWTSNVFFRALVMGLLLFLFNFCFA